MQTYKQEVTEAACELICDWAQKILKRSFDTVVEIARFLVQEHIVNPRCSQAELVTSAAMAGESVSSFPSYCVQSSSLHCVQSSPIPSATILWLEFLVIICDFSLSHRRSCKAPQGDQEEPSTVKRRWAGDRREQL